MEILMALKMWLLSYTHPALELLNKELPVHASGDCGGKFPASDALNGRYDDEWRDCAKPSEEKPAWIAFDLSKLREEQKRRIVLAWFNKDTSPYDHTLITAISNPGYNNPSDYTIEANAAAGGALPEAGWVKILEVKDNTFHSRQHKLTLKGYNWLRLSATRSDGTKDNEGISVSVDIYNASCGLADSWIFYGDSITQMAMNQFEMKGKEGGGSFNSLIKARLPKYYPLQECGGTGYMKSSDGAANIEKWLAMFPGKYVGISYGTNDAWAGMSPDVFYANCETMVKAVLAAKKVAMVSKIPWSSTIPEIQKNGALLNAEIDKLYKKYPQVVKGPDFWELYRTRPELLSQDGVHPSWPDGLFAFRKAWADVALAKIYGVK